MFYTAEIAVVNGEQTASLFKWETMDDARKRLHKPEPVPEEVTTE